MYILGIGGFSHDSAAALFKDGKLVAAAMEERFTRKKHEGGIPYKSIKYCLDYEGITKDDLDHVWGLYAAPGTEWLKRLPYRIGTFLKSPQYALAYFLYEFYHNFMYVYGSRNIKGNHTQLHFLNHHLAHAASCFYPSPFEEAAILSIDYIGEWTST